MWPRLSWIAAVISTALCAQPVGVERLPPLYREALDAFLSAQKDYRGGHYADAAQRLQLFWKRHPIGTAEWEEKTDLALMAGLNFGSPPCYSALRMLTECTAWRLRPTSAKAHPSVVRFTIVLVGHSGGIEPGSWKELHAHAGEMVQHDLDARMSANHDQIIHESLWLFEEYIRAITAGKLSVETSILRLPELAVPVFVSAGQESEITGAGIAGNGMASIWSAAAAAANKTDWWWIIYPSNVPEQHSDFADHEFVTGGMSGGPDGASPAFVIDDRWLIRKPSPFVGRQPYSLEERWTYLPQWFQHEFFHHLYQAYPELALEAEDHQWFDRRKWPGDFEGRFESDYYAESLHKRLQTVAAPPLDVQLRYAPAAPPARVSNAIEKLVTDFAAARNAHDSRAMAEMYAEDAALVPIGSNIIKGRDAIQKFWIPQLIGQATRTVRSIQFIGPNEAGVKIDVQVGGEFQLLDSWIVAKTNGKWRIKVHRSYQR